MTKKINSIQVKRESTQIVVYKRAPDNDPAPPKVTTELVKEGVRRVVTEYGEVLRRLADE